LDDGSDLFDMDLVSLDMQLWFHWWSSVKRRS